MDCFLDKPVNQAKLRLALSRLEAGAPLPPELPPCGEACCAPGGRGLSQPDGLSQPAGSLRPLGAEEAANCLAAVRSCAGACPWPLFRETIPEGLAGSGMAGEPVHCCRLPGLLAAYAGAALRPPRENMQMRHPRVEMCGRGWRGSCEVGDHITLRGSGEPARWVFSHLVCCH